MALNKEITTRITDLLVEHPQGLSITEIVKKIDVNRNTAGRYLENLLVSGQVEMRHFGMAKIYAISNRIPQSAMLSISSDLVMQLESGLRIVFANEPFLKLLGVSSAELFGKNIEYTAAVTVFDDALENFIRHLRDGVFGKEWRSTLTLNSGEQIFSCHIYPIAFSDGRKGVSVLLEDVTEFQRNECALRESEDRYRKLVEISPDAVILHCDGKIIYVNPAAQKLIGAQYPEEMVGKPVLDFIKPGFCDAVKANIKKDIDGELSLPMELQMLRLNGTSVTVEGRGVRTLIGGKSAVQVAIRDITARKRAEEALLESEEKYRTLVETTGTGFVIIDDQGRVLDANREYVDLSGHLSLDEIAGRNVIEWTAAYERDKNAEAIRQCVRDGYIRNLEIDYVNKSGTITPIEINSTVLRSIEGVQILTLCRNISERKLAEKKLNDSEDRYRTVFENTGTATVLIEEKTIISLANTEFERLSGYSKQEIEGKKSWTEFVVKEDLDGMLSQHEQRRQNGQMALKSYEFRFITRSGNIRTILLTADSIPGTRQSIASLMDITERKAKEDALIASEERYRCLLEQSFDAIAIHKNKKIAFLNEKAAKILGAATPQDLIGRSIFDLIHTDSRKDMEERIKKMSTDHRVPAPVLREKFLRVDGTTVTVEVMAMSFYDNGVPAFQVVFREIAS
ncbi:MAG: PAS domain S-box protein [Methanomicrobiales archaeon]